jgi:hypothetical protein
MSMSITVIIIIIILTFHNNVWNGMKFFEFFLF